MAAVEQDSSCNPLDVHTPYFSGYASRLLFVSVQNCPCVNLLEKESIIYLVAVTQNFYLPIM